MSVLKFTILIEELDDVYRDVELRSGQNFKDFHEAIVKFFNIRSKKNASFFTSNARWQKLSEITLGQSSSFENSIDGTKEKIGNVVNDNLQHLIYFNEGMPQFTFLVELDDIYDENPQEKNAYPRCLKSVGNPSSLAGSIMDNAFDENIKLHIDEILEEPEDDDFF